MNTNKTTDAGTKHITLGLVAGWTFGVFFTIGSLGVFSSSILGGLAVLLAGLILLPPVNTLLTEKLNVSLSGGIRTVIAIVLFVVGANTIPTVAQDEAMTVNNADTQTEAIDESTQQTADQETSTTEETDNVTPVANEPVVAQTNPTAATPETEQVIEPAPEQTETVTIENSPAADPRSEVLAILKANASSEWGDDYQMVQFEYNNQVEAYDWVMSRTAYPEIMVNAKREWNEDYQMVQFEYENQVEAYEWVMAQTQYPDIMARAKREWGQDYQMVKFEYENQVEAYREL